MSETDNSDIIQKSRIDTNIIIRYLMGDGELQAEKARNLFKRAAEGKEVLVLCDMYFLKAFLCFKVTIKCREKKFATHCERSFVFQVSKQIPAQLSWPKPWSFLKYRE